MKKIQIFAVLIAVLALGAAISIASQTYAFWNFSNNNSNTVPSANQDSNKPATCQGRDGKTCQGICNGQCGNSQCQCQNSAMPGKCACAGAGKPCLSAQKGAGNNQRMMKNCSCAL